MSLTPPGDVYHSAFKAGWNGYHPGEVDAWLAACRRELAEQAARLAAELDQLRAEDTELVQQIEAVREQVQAAAAKSSLVKATLREADGWIQNLLAEATNRGRATVAAAGERARGLRAEAQAAARECQDWRRKLAALPQQLSRVAAPGPDGAAINLQRQVRLVREGDGVFLAEELFLRKPE